MVVESDGCKCLFVQSENAGAVVGIKGFVFIRSGTSPSMAERSLKKAQNRL
jgi:hypothetical protein